MCASPGPVPVEPGTEAVFGDSPVILSVSELLAIKLFLLVGVLGVDQSTGSTLRSRCKVEHSTFLKSKLLQNSSPSVNIQ